MSGHVITSKATTRADHQFMPNLEVAGAITMDQGGLIVCSFKKRTGIKLPQAKPVMVVIPNPTMFVNLIITMEPIVFGRNLSTRLQEDYPQSKERVPTNLHR